MNLDKAKVNNQQELGTVRKRGQQLPNQCEQKARSMPGLTKTSPKTGDATSQTVRDSSVDFTTKLTRETKRCSCAEDGQWTGNVLRGLRNSISKLCQ